VRSLSAVLLFWDKDHHCTLVRLAKRLPIRKNSFPLLHVGTRDIIFLRPSHFEISCKGEWGWSWIVRNVQDSIPSRQSRRSVDAMPVETLSDDHTSRAIPRNCKIEPLLVLCRADTDEERAASRIKSADFSVSKRRLQWREKAKTLSFSDIKWHTWNDGFPISLIGPETRCVGVISGRGKLRFPSIYLSHAQRGFFFEMAMIGPCREWALVFRGVLHRSETRSGSFRFRTVWWHDLYRRCASEAQLSLRMIPEMKCVIRHCHGRGAKKRRQAIRNRLLEVSEESG